MSDDGQMERRKAGRPKGSTGLVKLTKDFIHDYTLLCEGGVPPKKACEQLGVSWQSLLKWKQQGKRHIEQQYPSLQDELYQRATTAETELGRQALIRIRDEIKNPDSKSGAKLSAWVAERVYPEEYGPPKQRTEHTSTVNVFKYEGMSLRDMMRALHSDSPTEDELLLDDHASDGDDIIDADWSEVEEPQDT